MSDSPIPPIPTFYAGVLFRSRTEARWAMFWQKLDIQWEYEPQGFKAAGIPYLPDFLICPALGPLWVEIKPSWGNDPAGVAKWREFAVRRPRSSRSALIVGLPTLHNRPLVIGGTDDPAGGPLTGPWEDDTQEWRPCLAGHHFDLCYPGTFGARYIEDGCPGDAGGGAAEQRIAKASRAALSARFTKGGETSGTAA